MKTKKVLILSNHFITIYNYRKELIKELIDNGNEVYISTPKSTENIFFTDLGCKIIDTYIDRRGINPINDIKLIIFYIKLMKSIKPDIIFSYTIKPNIYGSIASNIMKIKQINNITGTGATFFKKNIVSFVAKILYKISIKNSYKVFFQNTGDKEFFIENKMVKKNWDMLPGSGVNIAQYKVFELPNIDKINFIFIGRIMKIKGIDDYIECAKYIKSKYTNVEFYIAGLIEENKYKEIIEKYEKEDIIHYLGFKKDIKEVIIKCHCTVLPSYAGEGIPNVLLESSAMGRPCIASKINGSKDVIDDEITGYLFEPESLENLILKVEKFINLNLDEKTKMGLEGRKKVEKEFDRSKVIEIYFKELNKLEGCEINENL